MIHFHDVASDEEPPCLFDAVAFFVTAEETLLHVHDNKVLN